MLMAQGRREFVVTSTELGKYTIVKKGDEGRLGAGCFGTRTPDQTGL